MDAGRAVLGGGGTLQRDGLDGGAGAGGDGEAQGESVGGHLAAADGDEDVVEAALAGEFEQGGLDLGELEVQRRSSFSSSSAAAGQVLGALPLAEPLADLGAGVVGLEVAEGGVEPVAAGPRELRLVTISTTSPLLSGVVRATRRPLTFAPTQA